MDAEVGWPVPYWDLDAAMAVMLLLTAVDEGVEAWLFGVFHGAEALLRELGVRRDAGSSGRSPSGAGPPMTLPPARPAPAAAAPSTRSSTGAAGDWAGRPGAAAVSPMWPSPRWRASPVGPPNAHRQGARPS